MHVSITKQVMHYIHYKFITNFVAADQFLSFH